MQVIDRPFDPVQYKEATRKQWEASAEAWLLWAPTVRAWLGRATNTMLDLAGVGPGMRVLDLAAGAGGQALDAARRVGDSGEVVATDTIASLLEFASVSARDAGLTNVSTRVMDAEEIDLEPASFDVVICRLGLTYFTRPEDTLRQVHTVLKPGGKCVFMLPSTPKANEILSIPMAVVRENCRIQRAKAEFAGLFSFAIPGSLQHALMQSGFQGVRAGTIRTPLRTLSAAACARFIRDSFPDFEFMMLNLDPICRTGTWNEIAHAFQAFDGPDGFVGPCEMQIGLGVRPA